MQKGELHRLYLAAARTQSRQTHCLRHVVQALLMSFYLSHDLREDTGRLDKLKKYCSDMFHPWAASGGTEGRVEG